MAGEAPAWKADMPAVRRLPERDEASDRIVICLELPGLAQSDIDVRLEPQ